MGKTKIEWCEETWNPIAGCSDVSEGCRHCYARGMAGRLEAMGSEKYAGLTVLQGSHRVWTGKIAFDEKALLAPLARKKPTMYFANSMSDLFHSNVTDEMRDRIFAVMALCPQHTFQVLTKRPERILAYLLAGESALFQRWGFWACHALHVLTGINDVKRDSAATQKWPLPNVWLGVSVEDQETADARIPLLLQTPAAVRFVSAEPLLGPVSLAPVADRAYQLLSNWYSRDAFDPAGSQPTRTHMEGYVYKLDWVIAGGESGPGARPMHPEWARSLRDQCKAAGVPFFFKQRGEWAPLSDHPQAGGGLKNVCFWDEETRSFSANGIRTFAFHMARVGKQAAGHLLDGVAHREFPAVQA